TAFPNHSTQPKIPDDLPLIGLLSYRRRRSRGYTLPAPLLVFDDHRPAMIQNAIAKPHAGRKLASLVQVLVNRIAARKQRPTNRHLLADLQVPNRLFRYRRGQ